MFNSPGIDKILPYGSAPTIWISGFFDLIFLAIPAIVPPVPTPMMTASIFPEVWSNIYSPNWSKWAKLWIKKEKRKSVCYAFLETRISFRLKKHNI